MIKQLLTELEEIDNKIRTYFGDDLYDGELVDSTEEFWDIDTDTLHFADSQEELRYEIGKYYTEHIISFYIKDDFTAVKIDMRHYGVGNEYKILDNSKRIKSDHE